MKNRTMDVLRHDITDVTTLEIQDGPDTDVLGTQKVMTVVCGRVSGELDDVVSWFTRRASTASATAPARLTDRKGPR
jgi:hypothetical protein